MNASSQANNDQVRKFSQPSKIVGKALAQTLVEEPAFEDVEVVKAPFDMDIGGASNQPHPMLETAVVYNIFKRFAPELVDNLRASYSCRWRLSYPLQRRLPFSRFLQERLGVHLTWGELLLVLPFCSAVTTGLAYGVIWPDVFISGKVARAALIASFCLANRTNSVATFLLGMPFDRALYYHKVSGRLAGVASLLHLIAFYVDPRYFGSRNLFTNKVNCSGTVIFILLIGMVVTSLPFVRRRCYEVFYAAHRILAVGMVIGALFHSGAVVPVLVGLTWGMDVFLRKVILTNQTPIEAQIKTISNTVVRLSFDKGSFDYNPGQYVYVSVPELSWLQWHPFSMTSAPHGDFVEFHIRNVGDWTAALHQLAGHKDKISIYIQGPYGNLGIDLLAGDRKYKSIVLVSGGIGITPMQSVLQQLLAEHKHKVRQLQHVLFLWVERDPEFLVHESEVFLNDKEKMHGTLSSRLLSMLADSNRDDNFQAGAATKHHCGAKDQEVVPMSIDIQVFLTKGTVPPQLDGWAKQGRPDLPMIFEDLAARCSGKIAVLASAPHSVMDVCRAACVAHSSDSVRFDFHSESMAI